MQGTAGVAPPTRTSAPFDSTRLRAVLIAAYVALVFVLLAIYGPPDRPQIVIFIAGLIAVTCARSERGVRRFLMDWLPILVIAAGYDFVRSQAPDLLDRAIITPQLRFDEIVFGGTAPTVYLQDALVDSGTPHWWDYVAFCIYLSHFVFTLSVAAVLYVRARALFRRLAILVLTVSVAGFITYFIVPAVPPWLASRDGDLPHTVRLVHAVWADLGATGAAKVFAGDAKLANPVAALPSLHAAWPFLVLLLLWPRAGRWRWALVGYNAAMILTLVYGAEHYVSDILVGWLYAGVTFVVVTRILDARDARRAATASAR